MGFSVSRCFPIYLHSCEGSKICVVSGSLVLAYCADVVLILVR